MEGDLASRLRALREVAGLSQERVAERVGVARSHISNIESGRRGVSLEVLERFIAECGAHLEILPTGTYLLADNNAVPYVAGTSRQALIVHELARIIPHLPPAIVDDLEERVTAWSQRYAPVKDL